MRIRPALIAAAIALGVAGCSSVTDPSMSCTANPKCKADTQPNVPTTLQPIQVATP